MAVIAMVIVMAWVNWGRWIVGCPAGCGGASLAMEGAYTCSDCGASGCLVIFPTARRVIERILDKRPDPCNRNWQPGESLAQLRRENREHGVA